MHVLVAAVEQDDFRSKAMQMQHFFLFFRGRGCRLQGKKKAATATSASDVAVRVTRHSSIASHSAVAAAYITMDQASALLAECV